MRKLFAQFHVSVDGYFDGPNQELDWFVLDDEFFAYVEDMLGSIGGILLGRTTYEGFAAHWPNSTQSEAAAMNALPSSSPLPHSPTPRGPTRRSSSVMCPMPLPA
jgi:dihydrofolate reductase